MSALTTRLQLYKPGGGLSGLITPDEIADIDRINSNFDTIDLNSGFRVVTSGTRPLSPYDGLPILETDTKKISIWNNTAGQWQSPGAERGSGTDYVVADLNSLAGITDALPGDTVTVTAADGWTFQRNIANNAWGQVRPGRFASAATRTTEFAKAAGAYLVVGAQSIRADIGNSLWDYNGTAWVPAQALTPITPTSVSGAGTTLVGKTIVLGAATASQLNGLFTGDFDNYRVDIDITGSSGVLTCTAQLSLAGVADTAANYDATALQGVGVTASSAQALGTASWGLTPGTAGTNRLMNILAEFKKPSLPQPTQVVATGVANSTTMTTSSAVGTKLLGHRLTTSYDGLTLAWAGGPTGTIKVYGWNN